MKDWIEPEYTEDKSPDNPYLKVFAKEMFIKFGWLVKINSKTPNQAVAALECEKGKRTGIL
jgi:hypothetical protein